MSSTNVIMIVVLLVLFYVLMFLPQRRQQKKRATMRQNLQPGAKVLTAGGIYGQIIEVHEDILVIKIAQDVEIEMDQRSIMRVVDPATPAEPLALSE